MSERWTLEILDDEARPIYVGVREGHGLKPRSGPNSGIRCVEVVPVPSDDAMVRGLAAVRVTDSPSNRAALRGALLGVAPTPIKRGAS